MALRDYQQDVIDRTRAALMRVRRVLIQAPTGAGKTVLASHMAGTASGRGLVVWFVCHRSELVQQTSFTFARWGLRHSFIAAGRETDSNAQVYVCSIDTLKNRIAFLPQPQLVIWDECHHIGAAGWAEVMEKCPSARHVGLSATPRRLDGKGLDSYFDELVLGPAVAWLIEHGHLSPYRVFAPSMPDMRGVRRQAGDFSRGEAAAKMDKPKLTGDIIAHWLKHANGQRTVAFACTVEHSQHLAQQFVAAGIPAAHLDGGTPKHERQRIIQQYASGQLHVLTNVDLFGEGFDLSAIAQRDVTIDCVIQARPTQSLSLHLQQVGRALRPAPGKVAVILDHAGNTMRHGFADDEREWVLEGQVGTSRRAANDEGPPPPITCEGCYMQLRRPAPACCPYCSKPVRAEPKAIEVAEGELQEMTEVEKRQVRARRQQEEREAATAGLGALVALGQRRGYSSPQQWAFKRLSAHNQSRRSKSAA